jgi:hypothetical protein
MLEDYMAQNKIEVIYHYNNKELDEIIKRVVILKTSIDKEEIEKEFKQSNRKVHIFQGVLKCNECSGNMCYNERYKGYKCTNSQKIRGRCTAHSIKEEYLLEVIKKSIETYLENRINIEELYSIENKKYIIAEAYRKELRKIQNELKRVENQLEMMYLDDTNLLMSEISIESLMKALKKKQKFLNIKKGNVQSLIKKNEDEGTSYNETYKSKLDKILCFSHIDKNIIESLIDSIVVFENKSLKEKRVDVYYKFKKK